MKKELLVLLTLPWISTLAAQAQEVWACFDSRISGLEWQVRGWGQLTGRPSNFVLTLNGRDSSISLNGESTLLDCELTILPQIVRCQDILGIQLLFNTVTNLGTYSSIAGGVIRPGDDGIREDIQIKTFQCNRVRATPALKLHR